MPSLSIDDIFHENSTYEHRCVKKNHGVYDPTIKYENRRASILVPWLAGRIGKTAKSAEAGFRVSPGKPDNLLE